MSKARAEILLQLKIVFVRSKEKEKESVKIRKDEVIKCCRPYLC